MSRSCGEVGGGKREQRAQERRGGGGGSGGDDNGGDSNGGGDPTGELAGGEDGSLAGRSGQYADNDATKQSNNFPMDRRPLKVNRQTKHDHQSKVDDPSTHNSIHDLTLKTSTKKKSPRQTRMGIQLHL